MKITYSLFDIIVHMFDAFMLRAIDCPYCRAYELEDRAMEEGLPLSTSRKGLRWTAEISEKTCPA